LAATAPVLAYVGWSLAAFAALVGGLLTLGVYPIFGVLLTLFGMALLLYGAAGLCGARYGRKQLK